MVLRMGGEVIVDKASIDRVEPDEVPYPSPAEPDRRRRCRSAPAAAEPAVARRCRRR